MCGTGRPLAVRIRRVGVLPCAPCKHWKMALCSLSTGSSGCPAFFAASVTSSPPATSGSLLASNTRLPQASVSITAASPTTPTTETSTSSASHACTTSSSTFSPNIHWQLFLISAGISFGSTESAAIFGWNWRTCSKSFSLELCATNAVTAKRSLWRAATSSACVPMEPVEPNIANFRIFASVFRMSHAYFSRIYRFKAPACSNTSQSG